ncbi:CIA30 family protein [Reyranella aquatilis]|uniref:CIA30 family protein n=1 Tax=Reyranella aquatilis TaxID=2035356 RepID=A0ABS8KTK3_9HYPH|nr:CIA30 family protein [Reyranella aquatilis]MCC8429403.1 CIA30 family protein [Reyranella aquatilis]
MPSPIIDDLSDPAGLSALGTRWQLVTDQVMGGVSRGTLTRETVAGRPALVMGGDVRLENNGGFIQMALDLARPQVSGSGTLDARRWQGLEIDACGPRQSYSLHLRTTDLDRPWQSYRREFSVQPEWQSLRLAFADFVPHRTGVSLNLEHLRRLGIVAIGRAFTANLALGGVRFYG